MDKIVRDDEHGIDSVSSALDEGIAMETACMRDTEAVVGAFAKIREALACIGKSVKEALDAWESVRNNPDVAQSEMAPSVAETCIRPLQDMAKAVPEMARLFAIDERGALDPYRRNVADMRELKNVLELQRRIDEKERECRRTEAMRRRPLYRELRRMYQSLAGACPGILHGHYSSPNVDAALCETVYVNVLRLVNRARGRAAELKKVC